MSETTDRLSLPYLMPAQAQKHVTVNEALRRLDALVQPRVLSRTLGAEPAGPAAGDAYILPASASGASWDGFSENDLAVFQDGAWEAFTPNAGWQVFLAGEGEIAVFDGTAWRLVRELFAALQDLPRLGVGTSADGNNPFSAKLNAALWTALETGAGGTGDLRYTLNKEAPGNVLSLLLQSNWSGRAEFGLVGDDDVSLKVSPDGNTWHTAFSVDRNTGDISTGLSLSSNFDMTGRLLVDTLVVRNLFNLAGKPVYFDSDSSMLVDASDRLQIRLAGTEVVRIDGAQIGIGTTAPGAPLDVAGDRIRVRTGKTPASASDTGTAGTLCWDGDYIYVCVAADTWKRAALASW